MRRSVINMTVTLALALAPAAVFAQAPAGQPPAGQPPAGHPPQPRPMRQPPRKSHGWH